MSDNKKRDMVTLPSLWKLWQAEFCLAQHGMVAEPDIELAAAEADRAVAIVLPALRTFVRSRVAGEFPQVDPGFDAVVIERIGGTRTQPLIARLPCRAEDL